MLAYPVAVRTRSLVKTVCPPTCGLALSLTTCTQAGSGQIMDFAVRCLRQKFCQVII